MKLLKSRKDGDEFFKTDYLFLYHNIDLHRNLICRGNAEKIEQERIVMGESHDKKNVMPLLSVILKMV